MGTSKRGLAPGRGVAALINDRPQAEGGMAEFGRIMIGLAKLRLAGDTREVMTYYRMIQDVVVGELDRIEYEGSDDIEAEDAEEGDY